MFLSLAVIFGGVWFSRKRQTGGKMNRPMIAAGAMLFLVGSAAPFVYANIGPPTQLRTISGELFNRETFRGWNAAYGKVRIEISDGDGMIELIVPDKKEPKNE